MNLIWDFLKRNCCNTYCVRPGCWTETATFVANKMTSGLKNKKKQTKKPPRDVVTLKLVQLTHDAAETKIAVSPSHTNNVLTTVRGFCSWKPRSGSDLQHRGQLRVQTPGFLPACRTAAAEKTVKMTPGRSTGHIRSKKTDQRSLIPLFLSNKAITDCTEASIPQFPLVPLYWIHPCKQSRTECQQRLSEKKQNIKKPPKPKHVRWAVTSNHAVWVHLEQRVRALLDLKELITYATRPSSAPTLRQTTHNSDSRCSPLPQFAFTGTLESVLEMHPEPQQRDWKTSASSCICPRVTLPLDQESQNVEPTRGEKAKKKQAKRRSYHLRNWSGWWDVVSLYQASTLMLNLPPPPP